MPGHLICMIRKPNWLKCNRSKHASAHIVSFNLKFTVLLLWCTSCVLLHPISHQICGRIKSFTERIYTIKWIASFFVARYRKKRLNLLAKHKKKFAVGKSKKTLSLIKASASPRKINDNDECKYRADHGRVRALLNSPLAKNKAFS